MLGRQLQQPARTHEFLPQRSVRAVLDDTPVAVPGLSGATAITASLCALVSGKTVECLQSNLADGGMGFVTVSGLTSVSAISGDAGFVCAVSSGGTVSCWGNNSFGELGNGTLMAP